MTKWWRIFFFVLGIFWLVIALFQAYNMGYKDASYYYEQREFDLKLKHNEEKR